MNQARTLIFFANPFGYGPTGKCVALIKEMKKTWNGEIIFAGTNYSFNLLNQKKIRFEEINDRDVDQIKLVLKRYKNPYVVSCLNRFAIKASKDLKIPCAIVDSLSWFWKEFPDGLLDADIYFAQKLPNVNIDIPDGYRNKFIFVSAIVGTADTPVIQNNKVLLHIGGGENPFFKGVQKKYLLLLAALINNTKTKENIEVMGGKQSISFLEKNIHNSNFRLFSLERDKFLMRLAGSKRLITTPGLTANLEAMSFNIPVSFLFPANLSQWANQKIFMNAGINAKSLLWEQFFEIDIDTKSMTEKEGIPFVESLADRLLCDEKKLNLLQTKFGEMIENSKMPIGQNKFIKQMGSTGAEEISKTLQILWNS